MNKEKSKYEAQQTDNRSGISFKPFVTGSAVNQHEPNYEAKTGFENNFLREGIYFHASVFTGIGGFDLAAEWMGWENVFQVEIDKYCNKLLKQNFPKTKQYGDIKTFDAKSYKRKIDILTGGFPCQPFSIAGERNGASDNRFLWKEMLRVIKEVEPKFVVGENVPGIITMELANILASLEDAGYKTESFVIPACSTTAPHKRERVWILAYSDRFGCYNEQDEFDKISQDEIRQLQIEKQKRFTEQCGVGESGISKISADTSGVGQQRGLQKKKRGLQRKSGRLDREFAYIPDWRNFPVAPALCGKSDGVSYRVDRIKALGNAIVPQVAFNIFCLLEAWEKIIFKTINSRKLLDET